MRTRLQTTLVFFQNHRRLLRNITLLTAGTTAYLTCKTVIKKDRNLQDAYEKFRDRIKTRQEHHSISSLFPVASQTRFFSPTTQETKQKSIEPITHLKTNFLAAPAIVHEDGSRSELNALSPVSWKEFIDQSSNEIYITFGHRKAFSASNPIRFTHAVLYICDSEGQHALYGYSKSKASLIDNDYFNSTVSRDYTLYPDLTIRGNKEQVHELFKRIEQFALQRYTAIGCNCYSPLISGLLEAQKLGFKVPKEFNDSLLIVIPSEQNYGMGITANRYLKPLSDSAVVRTKKLFLELKESASHKMDEVFDHLQQKRKR